MASPESARFPQEGQVTADTVDETKSDSESIFSHWTSSDGSPVNQPPAVVSDYQAGDAITPPVDLIKYESDYEYYGQSSGSASPFACRNERSYVDVVIEGVIKKLEEVAREQDRADAIEQAKEAIEANRGPIMASAEAPYRPPLVFVDGTFAELAQELADYLQVGDEVKAALAQDQREDALAKIVRASPFLHSAPEKDIVGAYNLLIHLVINESKDPKKYLQTLCTNLHKPFTSSPSNGANIALTEFQAIFNLLPPGNQLRYHVFGEILKFSKSQGLWETLKVGIKDLPKWLENWEVDEEDQRKMFLNLAEFAMESGDDE